MKYHFILSLLFFSFSLFSQEKGVSPINEQRTTNNEQQNTYAVVVGISDYQDEGIPDLRFADKDAEAFANFLRSPSGGNLDGDHLKVLVNEQATLGQFAAALDWLWEVANEDDRVIIYFSGHGDVEKKSILNPGYLLCWDAPESVYMGGGALNVRDLKGVVSTLSLQNKAKVVLITDACRAGKLSGSEIKGAQATASTLNEQFANEIKILSCQPDEYSIEGEQWGGGRGAFSYHLIDGLYGMADRNTDLSVNLMEIRSYLEENVSAEVAPHNQYPMVVGNGREKLTDVFPDILEQLKEGKKGQMQLFSPTDSRGMEEEVLAAADPNVVEMFLAFQKAIEAKDFLEPENACADYYYNQLSEESQLKPLHSSMRRNYAAALQDDAQQVLNRILKSNLDEDNLSLYTINERYRTFPRYLQKAADLLGKEHYMYNYLIARKYWFQAYLIDETGEGQNNPQKAKESIALYEKALSYQPNMPQAYLNMASLYGIQLLKLDSAEYYAGLAKQALPNWGRIYMIMGNVYSRAADGLWITDDRRPGYLEQGKGWIREGLEVDSDYIFLLNELSYLYNLGGNYQQEQEILGRSLQKDSLTKTMWYRADGYFSWGKYNKAEAASLWTLKKDSTFIDQILFILVSTYAITGQRQKLEQLIDQYFLDRESPDPTLVQALLDTPVRLYAPDIALPILLKAAEKDTTNVSLPPRIAQYYFHIDPPDYQKVSEWQQRNRKFTGPYAWSGYFTDALIYLHDNQMEKAWKAMESGMNTKPPKRADAYINSVRYLYYLQNEQPDSAEVVLKNVMENFSPEALPWFLRNKAYPFLHDPGMASESFKKVEALYPENPYVNYELAKHYAYWEKNKEAAFMELEKAMKKGMPFLHLVVNSSSDELAILMMEEERWDALMQKYFPDQYKD